MKSQIRFFALFLLLCLLVQPFTALAAEPGETTESVSEDESAELSEETASGSCGDDLTWTLEDGVLTISGTGDMTDFDYDGLIGGPSVPWSNYSFEKVIIEEGVTSIGTEAFEQCDMMTDISISKSVCSIGDFAFYGCDGLLNVTIPEGVTSIGDMAFENCSELISITLPDSLKAIGMYAFCECFNLYKITIPEGITSIEEKTFYRCFYMTSITIPASVTSIGEKAFYGCSDLDDVYYAGSKEAWANISIADTNTRLSDGARIHYNATGPEPISVKEIEGNALTLNLSRATEGTMIIAVYDESGKFTSMTTVQLTSEMIAGDLIYPGIYKLTLDEEVESTDIIKAFVVDASWTPLCKASVLQE